VLESIIKGKPSKLYVAADGPRPYHQEDIDLCLKTKAIIKETSFKFPVITLFRDENLGCKNAVSSAIDWFFSHESEGIILEDDCLPNQDFFQFCEKLLERYRDDTRIMMISGDNFFYEYHISDSYYFSRMTHIWGWATWKRAWKHYDVNMELWNSFKEKKNLHHMFPKHKYWKGWEELMDNTYSGKMNTWDYQWQFTCWMQGGLSIMPKVNLVTNIGTLDPSGTHTNPSGSDENIILSKSLDYPIKHPKFIIPDYYADNIMLERIFPTNRKKLVLRWCQKSYESFFRIIRLKHS
jgi:hypothetical protein